MGDPVQELGSKRLTPESKKVVLPERPAADESKTTAEKNPVPTQPELPRPVRGEHLFLGNPLFPNAPSEKSFTTEVQGRNKELSRFGNEYAKDHNFHDLLGALEDKAKAAGENKLRDLFSQMKDAVVQNQVKDINSFRSALRSLLYEHGLYVDTPFEGSSLSQRVSAVTAVLTFESKNKTSYPVHLVETSVVAGGYGRFTPFDMAVVDAHSAGKAPGERATTAVMANELAHYYLSSRGFLAYPDKFVSLSGLNPEKYSAGTPAREALTLLKAEKQASNMHLHELVSDCWSTAESPTFDQHRLLQVFLQHESTELAKRQLGKASAQHNYGLTLKIYQKVCEDTLSGAAEPKLLQESIEELASYHKRFMQLTDKMRATPTDKTLEAERSKINSDYGEVYKKALERIKTNLGAPGLTAQREAFSAVNAEILAIIAPN